MTRNPPDPQEPFLTGSRPWPPGAALTAGRKSGSRHGLRALSVERGCSLVNQFTVIYLLVVTPQEAIGIGVRFGCVEKDLRTIIKD
jgi:hypothetical protein